MDGGQINFPPLPSPDLKALQMSYVFYLGCDFEKAAAERVQKALDDSMPAFLSARVPQPELKKAFAWGYVHALHKCRIASPMLMEQGEDVLESVWSEVCNDTKLMCIASTVYVDSLAGQTLKWQIVNYFLDNSELSSMHIVNLSRAFLAGYWAAHIVHHQYNYHLLFFSDVAELRNTTYCDLNEFWEEVENDRRYCNSLAEEWYRGDKEKFCLELWPDDVVGDDGEVQQESGTGDG